MSVSDGGEVRRQRSGSKAESKVDTVIKQMNEKMVFGVVQSVECVGLEAQGLGSSVRLDPGHWCTREQPGLGRPKDGL